MIGNSPGSTTPFPDPPASSDDGQGADPIRPPASHREENKVTAPDSASADDLGLLISDPDPFLSDEAPGEVGAVPGDQGQHSLDFPVIPASPAGTRPNLDLRETVTSRPSLSPENGLVLPVEISPCPDLLTRSTADSAGVKTPAIPHRQEMDAEAAERPKTRWAQLVVASYASAVTLALLWVLLTGRGLRHGNPTSESTGELALLDSTKALPVRPGRAAPPLPARNVGAIGMAIGVGDLELEPRAVTRRPVDLVRLDGATGETRQVEGVLILSLGLTNRSADQPLQPLEPTFIRDTSQADDQSFVETADGRRIPMLRLATESEWSIADQAFPILQPGERADTLVVSEPIQAGDLAGTLTWHIKLRTGTYRIDVVGVRFTAADVED